MGRGTALREHHAHTGYRHEALVYAGLADFLQATVAFIRDGIAAGEQILVVVSQAKIDLIRAELGPGDAAGVIFADMAKVGSNPGRIIALWYAFLADQGGSDRPVRGIGEPIDELRSPAELSECQLHEALLNMVFESASSFWLMCPYDLESLADDVVAEALRTHPYIASGPDRRASAVYQAPDPRTLFDRDFPDLPAWATRLEFGSTELDVVRDFVSEQSLDFGLDKVRSAELVVAINELATNAIEHGGGGGDLSIWADDDALICEVADRGRFDAPLAGRLPPALARDHGRGLWIANQLCDLVQIRSGRRGTVVRAHLRRAG
jgi:anti-sigma regulatory factor (Ser/Thr protein kinase)